MIEDWFNSQLRNLTALSPYLLALWDGLVLLALFEAVSGMCSEAGQDESDKQPVEGADGQTRRVGALGDRVEQRERVDGLDEAEGEACRHCNR